jgi:hypothetical protein
MHNNHITPQRTEQPVYAKNRVHETQVCCAKNPARERTKQRMNEVISMLKGKESVPGIIAVDQMSRSLERGIDNVKMQVIFLGLTHNQGVT